MALKSDRRRSIPAATDGEDALVALASAPLVPVELVFDYSEVAEPVRGAVEDSARFIKERLHRVRNDLIAVGDRLHTVKSLMPHGQFGDWILTEFHLSQRMAQNMMNVAERFGAKNETVALFSDSALYLLAAPSTPEAAIEAAARLAQQRGRSPSRSELKAIIDAHKAIEEPATHNGNTASAIGAAATPAAQVLAGMPVEPAHSVQGTVTSAAQREELRHWLQQWEVQAETFVAVTGKGAVKKALARLMGVMLSDIEAAEQALGEL